ncbi:unnamed protein product [Peniophora sp. CBMAI 1063]|nr:unnamed protein product [Peniophora sp. CBMAI 1063]
MLLQAASRERTPSTHQAAAKETALIHTCAVQKCTSSNVEESTSALHASVTKPESQLDATKTWTESGRPTSLPRLKSTSKSSPIILAPSNASRRTTGCIAQGGAENGPASGSLESFVTTTASDFPSELKFKSEREAAKDVAAEHELVFYASELVADLAVAKEASDAALAAEEENGFGEASDQHHAVRRARGCHRVETEVAQAKTHAGTLESEIGSLKASSEVFVPEFAAPREELAAAQNAASSHDSCR